MKDRLFAWDPEKNKRNIVKHGISFAEAERVFYDDCSIYYFDEEHSFEEDRFIVIGKSDRMRLLMVCHCYRDNDSVTRIISARKANKYEQALYGGVR